MLSTERLSIEECVDEIEAMLGKKAFQESPESLRLVDDLAVEWAVRSALRRDARTAEMSITVAAREGRVCLSGVAADEEEIKAAGVLASAVEGCREVDNQLKTTTGAYSRYRREG